MAVRPVDSLTMVPRLNEAGRHTHQQEQQPYAFQHVLGANMQDRAQRERTQVKGKEKAEQQKVQREKQGGGNGQGAQAQGDRRQRAPETPRRPSATSHGGRLDVKV
ncbi:MAG: hypothetical protein ACOY94_28065 [Bacillota bacterium]